MYTHTGLTVMGAILVAHNHCDRTHQQSMLTTQRCQHGGCLGPSSFPIEVAVLKALNILSVSHAGFQHTEQRTVEKCHSVHQTLQFCYSSLQQ